MKLPNMTEDEVDVMLDLLVDFKNRGKLPISGRYSERMLDALYTHIRRMMPRFHLSLSDMLRANIFWECQYKSIAEMLNSGMFVWDTQTTCVVEGPKSGGLDLIQVRDSN